MAVFKCKMCGGNLEIDEGTTVATCDYCGSVQTISKSTDEIINNLFNRANNLRIRCEFDKAQEVYEKILDDDNTDAEAHWGVVISKYGIEYVEDPKTHKRIPTCHRMQYESILTDVDYLAAIENADSSQQAVYAAEAVEISKLQKSILAIVKAEKPFDVFICYKETDDNGKRTQDSVLANDIYYELTEAGFKVFYSAITLEDKLGQEYEPYIFAALNSAKVMLVVGSKPEYFDAIWVKNEWSRFLSLMKNDRSRILIPCYRDMDAYDLPEDFSHLQAQDMSKIGFINDVTRGIKKLIDDGKNINKTEITTVEEKSNLSALLKRAYIFLEDEEWQSANEYCEKVLDADPENAEAYLGKLLANLNCHNKDELKNLEKPFDDNALFNKIMRYGNTELQNELKKFLSFINERNKIQWLESVYNSAINNLNNSLFDKAMLDFKRIIDYKDSRAKVEECRKKAEQCRIKEEKKKKEAAKIAKIAIISMLICVLIVIAFPIYILPNIKYNKAERFVEKGNFEEAYSIYAELGNYKDSQEKLSNISVERLKTVLPGAAVGETVKFGLYEQDNDLTNGKESIEWILLAKKDNRALLISKYCLDCQPYNEEKANATWETCSLRKWLNNSFLNSAFSADESAFVLTSNITNPDNPAYLTDSGNDTFDKIFLLSTDEADRYFPSDTDRLASATSYVMSSGLHVNNGNSAKWWLRTSGITNQSATIVDTYGGLYGGNSVSLDDIGVRPAMWISLD